MVALRRLGAVSVILSNRSRVILQARLGLTDAFVNCPMPGSA